MLYLWEAMDHHEPESAVPSLRWSGDRLIMQTPQLPDVFAREPRASKPQYVNRVSSICHPCIYHNYLARTRWRDRAPWSETFLRIFELGKKIERETIAAMFESGLEVIRAQETLEWPELNLTGHDDGLFYSSEIIAWMKRQGLELDPDVEIDPNGKAVWDVKSQDPCSFGKWRSLEEFLAPPEGASIYHMLYVGQLSLYADKLKAEWCCIYFVNRSTYETKQVWWRADHPLAVAQIQRAYQACREINRAIERPYNKIADQLASPGRWCDGCAFKHTCERYLLAGDEIHVKDELAELVEIRQSTASFRREINRSYDGSNNRLKEIWKKRHEKHGDHEVLCGDTLVKIKKDRRGIVRATYKMKGG